MGFPGGSLGTESLDGAWVEAWRDGTDGHSCPGTGVGTETSGERMGPQSGRVGRQAALLPCRADVIGLLLF